MTGRKRPLALWGICVFLALSVVVLLLGQTSALFAYDFAVSLGLQESVEDVTEFGVEVNRAFGGSDTIVYIPLMVLSLVGLARGRRWALAVTAAAMGVSVYWAVTVGIMLAFLRGTPGYGLVPGMEYWVFLGVFIAVGAWGIIYIALRGDRLTGSRT
jgi:hypothetical protein